MSMMIMMIMMIMMKKRRSAIVAKLIPRMNLTSMMSMAKRNIMTKMVTIRPTPLHPMLTTSTTSTPSTVKLSAKPKPPNKPTPPPKLPGVKLWPAPSSST